MSRGIGKVQRRILEVLEDGRRYVPRGLAVEVFETGDNDPTNAQQVSTARAVAGLKDRGRIEGSPRAIAFRLERA